MSVEPSAVLVGMVCLIVSVVGAPGRAVARVPSPPPPLARSVDETAVIVLVEVESDEAQDLREGESRSWYHASQVALTCRILRVLKAPTSKGLPPKVTVRRAFRGCLPGEHRLRKKSGRIEEYSFEPQRTWSPRKGEIGRRMLLFLDSPLAGGGPFTPRYTELDSRWPPLSADDAVARVESLLGGHSGRH